MMDELFPKIHYTPRDKIDPITLEYSDEALERCNQDDDKCKPIDWDHVRGLRFWEAKEAACLLMLHNPDAYISEGKNVPHEELEKLIKTASRDQDKASPAKWVAWARDRGLTIYSQLATLEDDKQATGRNPSQQKQIDLIEKMRELMQHELDTTWPEGKRGLKMYVIRQHGLALQRIYGKVADTALQRKTQPSECKKLGIPPLPK